MKIRTTEKMIVASYHNYEGDKRSGPADVYYSRADFAEAAKNYGWGYDVQPLSVVNHMGDDVTMFSVLHGAMAPVRVRYL